MGKLLLENGIITEDQLQNALERQKRQGGYIGQSLVELGYTTEEEIVSCLTVQYGYPYLPLRNYEIDREIIKLIPPDLAKSYYVIPIDRIGDTLTVAMANPMEDGAVEAIEKAAGLRIEIFVSTGSEIKSALEEYYGLKTSAVDMKQMLSDVNMHEEKKKT